LAPPPFDDIGKNSQPDHALSILPRSSEASAALETQTKRAKMSNSGRAPIPRATYRLQFHKGFGFQDAAALAPYLARLGVSHVYASPYLMARPGSTHGYDLVDHVQLNPELGDETAFQEMVTAFPRQWPRSGVAAAIALLTAFCNSFERPG
jgi:glycosidase